MIRYDKKLLSLMDKTVRQYNRKIDSLKGIKDLPEKISVEDLRDEYLDRGDLLKRLSELQLYSKQGSEELVKAEGGFTASQYELDLIKSERNSARRSLAMQRYLMEKDLDVFQRKTDDIYLNLLSRQSLLSKDISDLKDRRQFERYLKNMQATIFRETRNRNFYGRFFKDLFRGGNYIGYDSEKLDEIYTTLSKLSPSKLIRLTQTNALVKYLQNLPPSPKRGEDFVDPQELTDVLNNLYEHVGTIVEGA